MELTPGGRVQPNWSLPARKDRGGRPGPGGSPELRQPSLADSNEQLYQRYFSTFTLTLPAGGCFPQALLAGSRARQLMRVPR